MSDIGKILIVEDSPTQAALLQAVLQKNGYSVTTAMNGDQALHLAREHQPILVISDIDMPIMNGYELCLAIKQDAQLRETLVLLLTSWPEVGDVLRGLEVQADCYVNKPYNTCYLLSRIESVLHGWHGRADLVNQPFEILVDGKPHTVTAGSRDIINYLLCTYSNAVECHRELIDTQKELMRAKLAKSRFLASSHELRRLLKNIVECTDTLLTESPGSLAAHQEKQLRRIENSAHQLLSLTNDLLTLPKIESAKPELLQL